MLRNFLITAFRNVWRSKIHSLINIVSLTTGLTVFAFAFVYVKNELSYDRGWPEAERIHRLTLEQKGLPGNPDGTFNTVVARAYPSIKEYFADEFDAITRAYAFSVQMVQEDGKPEPFSRGLTFVDPAYADIFRMPMVAGSLENVLAAPGLVALEASLAESLGERAALGRRLQFTTGFGTPVEYEVGAIYRLPQPVSATLRPQMLTLISDYSLPLFNREGSNMRAAYWENSVQVWLRLNDDVSTDAFNAMQPEFIQNVVTAYDTALGEDRKISDHLFYEWQPVTAIHFNPVSTESFNSYGIGNAGRVASFAVVGLLVLLAGCSNAVSLNLAAAMGRRKEIAIRKASGAMQKDIMLQHVGESVLFMLVVFIPTVAVLHFLQPHLSRLSPVTFAYSVLQFSPLDYVWLAVISLATGLANGVYPALILSRVKPHSALKSSGGSGMGGQRLRSFLVSIQFFFASLLLIGTAALYAQLQTTLNQPLGFNKENLVHMWMTNDQQRANSRALADALLQVPGIESLANAGNPPNINMPLAFNSVQLLRRSGERMEVKAQMMPAGIGFFEIAGIPLLAGRVYSEEVDLVNGSPAQTQYSPDTPARMVANRSTIRSLGFEQPADAVGQLVVRQYVNGATGEIMEFPLEIIGVVEDHMYMSFSRQPGPEIYPFYFQPTYSSMLIRYSEAIEDTLVERIGEVSERITGSKISNVNFVEDRSDANFMRQRNESRLLLISGVLSLVLACAGLFGMASFTLKRQVKEVGIRKVLGAGVKSIVLLFLRRFTLPVLFANILAWPIVVYLVLQWMEQFPFQMSKAWFLPICFGTSLVVLAISLVTVSVITTRAATAKPVRSLRYE